MQTSGLHVLDLNDRVIVTCVCVFYVGRCRKMVCGGYRRNILTRLDVRGTFGRCWMYRGLWSLLDIRGTFCHDSMYGGHFAATRFTEDILPRLDVGGHFAATRCTGDIWTLLDVRGTFCRDSMYGGHLDATQCMGDTWSLFNIRWTFCRDSVCEEIWKPLDVRGHFDATRCALINMSQMSVPDCCSVWWPTLIIKYRIAVRCWRFPDTQRRMIVVSLRVLSSCNRC